MGIPACVTVRLAVGAGAFTVPDSIFKAVTGTFPAFPCGGINGRAVAGNGKAQEVEEAVPGGVQEEKILEYLEKPEAGLPILRRCLFQFFKEFLNGKFFNRGSFLAVFLWFGWFYLRGMDFRREIVITGKPETGLEIVKSTSTEGIPDRKTGEDGMEMVFLEVSSPFCIGSDLEFDGEEDGAEHVGRESGSRKERQVFP